MSDPSDNAAPNPEGFVKLPERPKLLQVSGRPDHRRLGGRSLRRAAIVLVAAFGLVTVLLEVFSRFSRYVS